MAPHAFKWLLPAGGVDFGRVKNRGLFKETGNSCWRGEARPDSDRRDTRIAASRRRSCRERVSGGGVKERLKRGLAERSSRERSAAQTS